MLQIYKNQNMGQAQLNAPQMRNITTGGAAGLMPTDNIVMGKKAMGAIFDAMAERQRVQDNTDLAAASSELQKQVIAFQSQYRQQNMGRDARDAGDVWAQNVGEMAGKIGEQFQGRPDLQARFKQAAQEMAVRSYASGFSYADQEEAKYRDATREEKLALLTDAIGTGTPMDIASAKQDYEHTLALLYPGRNLQPELMAADRLVAGGLIDRALAENDIREARALYGEQKAQLGKDAPSYLSKIDAKAEALERKAEANRGKDAKKAAIAELGNINALIANCDPNDFAAQEAAINSELERIAQKDPELALALAPLTSKRLAIAKQNYVSQTGQQYTAWMENSDFVNAEPQTQLIQIEQAHAGGQLTDDAYTKLWQNVTAPVKVSDPDDYNELSENIASFKDDHDLTVAAKNRRISDDDLKVLKAQLKQERELGKEFEAELKEYFKFMEEKHGMNANSNAKTGQQFRMFVTQTIDDWRKANNGKRPSMTEVRVLMDEAVKDVVFKKGWIRDETRPLYLAYSEIGPVAWEEIRRQIAEEHDKPLSAVTDEEIIATANRPDNADAGEDEEYTVDYGYSFTRGR